jgi:hypothetical protein
MIKEIVKIYDTKEEALKDGEDYKKWLGYEYTIHPENVLQRSGNVQKWKLIATTNQTLMG